jgi:pimeloyl-ACP methyl ester carboxylesterase
MNTSKLKNLSLTLGLALLVPDGVASAQKHVGPLVIREQGVFFVDGVYNDPAHPTFMSGHMYVRFQIPAKTGARHVTKYPIVMIHGGGQQTTTFTGTPDDRSGWADYFLSKGWPVYVVDQPGRGRSAYINSVYGPRGTPNVTGLENQFTAPKRTLPWPQAALHTQWPGTGVHGDYAFDQFFASQFSGMGALLQEEYTSKALIALLDQIGPAVLLTHSQSGPHGWKAADSRPNLVKALLVVEPNGPPFYNDNNTNIDRPWGITRLPLTFDPPAHNPSQLSIVQEAQPQGAGLYRCWKQTTPARQLPRLAGIPILLVTGEASFRAQYDHCTSQFLTQAGVANEHVPLEDVGIHGNGHMMMLEKNNLEIAAFMETWLRTNLRKSRR